MGNKIYYKYLDLEGAIKSLSNLTLKYSSPQCVNDPTEFFVSGFQDITEADAPKIFNYFNKRDGNIYGGFRFEGDVNNKENLAQELDELRKQLFAKYSFISLSHSNSNLSMWNLYANKHSGVVIGYDEDAFQMLFDVKYTQFPPLIKHNCVLNEREREEQLINILTTKSIDWKNEQEARDILCMDWKDPRRIFYENGLLTTSARFIKEIYFGINCFEKTRKQIRQICNQRHIQCSFFEIVLDYSNYISIKPIK